LPNVFVEIKSWERERRWGFSQILINTAATPQATADHHPTHDSRKTWSSKP
jgi:hypothetical protein